VAHIPYTVGGKGINVARMLKTFGRPARALSFAGGGNGERMSAELKQQSIPAKFIRSSAETRMGIELFSSSPGNHRWWIEDGEELKEPEILAMLDLIDDEAGSASIVAMSGTIPGRSNQDFYRRVLERLRSFKGEIYLDARGEPLRQACEAGGFFLKHNRDEALETFGLDPFCEGQGADFFGHLEKFGIWGAMITNGRGKVILWDGRVVFEFMPAPAAEICAVGCGDATLAGFVYGRRNGMSLQESAVLGLAAGAADAEKSGPCEAEYNEIYDKINKVSLVKKTEIFRV
jgi:fructose-1-phosphate kinase PfkB-like protein